MCYILRRTNRNSESEVKQTLLSIGATRPGEALHSRNAPQTFRLDTVSLSNGFRDDYVSRSGGVNEFADFA